MEFDELSNKNIGCAIEVHKATGPGLLESVYEQCLAYELSAAGIPFKRQTELPIEYKGNKLEGVYRVDFLVNDRIIVELKAVEKILDLHQAHLNHED